MHFDKPSDLKILFMGTPSLAGEVLKAILDAGFDVVSVISQEDKEQGRKRILVPTPTKEVALAHNIPVFQPHRIRKDHDFLKNLQYDIIVCVAYGQIVPDDILTSCRLGAFNLHGSLLPKYRGAAPMQRAIMNGENETGVCLMRMVSEMDAGEVYDRLVFPIGLDDNYTTISKKMADAASKLIVADLLRLANNELAGIPQNASEVTFAAKILPSDEKLPLSLSAKETHDYIRALSAEPGAYVYLDDKKVKILRSEMTSLMTTGEPGTLFADRKHLYLNLKDGVLSLTSIQPEGKKPMDAASFLNGHHIEKGSRLR